MVEKQVSSIICYNQLYRDSYRNLSNLPGSFTTQMEFFEDKLRGLESDNFDLKLQMYYSSIKAGSNGSEDLLSVSGDIDAFPVISSNRNLGPPISKDVNVIVDRGKRNLESELGPMKSEKKSELKYPDSQEKMLAANLAAAGGSFYSSKDPIQIDENRKHEREATLAITAHDAILIRRLESEVKNLQLKHQYDLVLMKEGAQKLAGVLRENNEKDLIISSRDAASQSLEARMTALSALLKDSDRNLEAERTANRIAVEKVQVAKTAEENRSWGRTANGKHDVIIKQEHQSRPPLLTRQSSYDEPNKLNESRNDLSSKAIVTRSSFNDNYSQPMSTLSSGRTSNNSTAFTPRINSFMTLRSFEPEKRSDNMQTVNEQLRIENAKLSEMLERERILSEGQEEALNQVRESAEEITLLEAEEIARLETELIKSSEENDYWRKKCKLAEIQVEQLSVQLRHLKHVGLQNINYANNSSAVVEKEIYVSKYLTSENNENKLDNHDATVRVNIGGGRCAYHPVQMIR